MTNKPSILVIDDEESIRFTFENFLSEEGYGVMTACNYDDGMALIRQKGFDLIFADIILGGKTGLELICDLKAMRMNCHVVIITGDPTAESSSIAFQNGAFDYIHKPVLKKKLLKVAGEALKSSLSFKW